MNFASLVFNKERYFCLNCGSIFCKAGFFCEYCESKIKKSLYYGLQCDFADLFKSYYLFEWEPGKNEYVSRLVHSLKEQKSPVGWRYWAEQFFKQRQPLLPDKKLVFIPAPSSQKNRMHAHLFAQAFAELSGGEYADILERESQTTQKSLSRQARRAIGTYSRVNIAKRDQRALYILVDDVQTTGATARSCYFSLKKPLFFETWNLAKRGLACGLESDLL